MKRRQALKLLGGGLATVGTGKAAHNTVIGYGTITGTNVTEQDLRPLFAERLDADDYRAQVGEYELELDGDELTVRNGDEALESLSVTDATTDEAAAVDAEYDLSGGPVEQLVRDVPALRAGEFVVEPSQYDRFFDRLAEETTRPYAVGATRDGFRGADPEMVASFLGFRPTDPERVVVGLVDAFREHTSYDVPRYVAGSIEDNVIFGRKDLRQYFETDVDFEALQAGEAPGLFCTELLRRSAEALHAIPAHEASEPVAAAYVSDQRHKHAFTAIASLYRDDGDLVMPVTFVDYTYSTLYDDFKVTWLTGEGLTAYDTHHRATDIYWDR